MTVTTAPDVTPASASSASTDPGAGQVWQAVKGPLTVLVVVLLAGLVVALAAGGPTGGRLDPRSAAPSGSRALAQVLGDQGVQVERVTTSAAMVATTGPDDTLLVVDPDLLAASQVAEVRATGADLVVVGATAPGRYLPGVTAEQAEPGVRTPGCDLPVAQQAGAVDAGGIDYVTDDTKLRAPNLCYAGDGRPSLVQVRVDSNLVTLLGPSSPLTNSRLDDEGDAALALGLLGGHDRLVWYLPTAADVPPSAQKSFYELVPDGVWWGLLQVGVAVLLLALWRARRLGAVVVEPLPVAVRAAETEEGRARLYRRNHARGQASESLRAGVRSRLGNALGLPRRADPQALVTAAAARSGWSGADVTALLYGAAPADDAALVQLADRLDALEKEVRRP
ncbi:MAG: hypothetical protein QOD68_506 [Actinomycetota bacterium]|nr:hypothetical protein [Actinomycetota bacterium]